jgi:hypothetical protein
MKIAIAPARIARPRAVRRRSCASAALLALVSSTLVGCGESPEGAQVTSSPPAPVTPINPLGRARCRPPAGATGSPRTISEAVRLLNALPKPTSVACFVESLDRPLAVFATSSSFSAQPALSPQSPRVFIQRDQLWLSLVIDGESSYLIEFGEITAPAADDPTPRSLKGELQLPLSEAVAPSAPFDRVRYASGTVCGLCHTNEEPATSLGLASAFTSTAYRPRPETRVSLDALRVEDHDCRWAAEPHRCEMLSAVFQGGEVAEIPFPNSMRTFY